MTRTHEVPSFMTSMLDLLCSALGGVALLVFLFAALRKNDLNQQAAVGRQTLVVEIVGPKGAFEVGRDVYFQLEPEARRGGQLVVFRLDRPDDVNTKTFKAIRSFPAERYDLLVEAEPGSVLRLGVWLRAADPARLADPEYRTGLSAGVRGRAYWSGRPEGEREFRLLPQNQYLTDLTLEVP